MNRRPVFWCQAPDTDDPEAGDLATLDFRVAGDWLAVDADQLVMPVVVIGRNYQEVEPTTGLLKQYGGESLLNDLLLADQDLDEGSEWRITTGQDVRRVDALDRDD
jgi:hypothetical protein